MVLPGEKSRVLNLWRHKKSGKVVAVLDNDLLIEKNAERAVLYQELWDSRKWVRPFSEFHDGRFESLNRLECVDGKLVFSHSSSF